MNSRRSILKGILAAVGATPALAKVFPSQLDLPTQPHLLPKAILIKARHSEVGTVFRTPGGSVYMRVWMESAVKPGCMVFWTDHERHKTSAVSGDPRFDVNKLAGICLDGCPHPKPHWILTSGKGKVSI